MSLTEESTIQQQEQSITATDVPQEPTVGTITLPTKLSENTFHSHVNNEVIFCIRSPITYLRDEIALLLLSNNYLEEDIKLKNTISAVWELFRTSFSYWPAGRVKHHTTIGGLGIHLAEMWYYFKWLPIHKEVYKSDNTYEPKSLNLFLKGMLAVLLHDIEKPLDWVETFTVDVSNVDKNYTTNPYGTLLSSYRNVAEFDKNCRKRKGEFRIKDGDVWGEKEQTGLIFCRRLGRDERLFTLNITGIYTTDIEKTFFINWLSQNIRNYISDADYLYIPPDVYEAVVYAHLGFSETKPKRIGNLTYLIGIVDMLSACVDHDAPSFAYQRSDLWNSEKDLELKLFKKARDCYRELRNMNKK